MMYLCSCTQVKSEAAAVAKTTTPSFCIFTSLNSFSFFHFLYIFLFRLFFFNSDIKYHFVLVASFATASLHRY